MEELRVIHHIFNGTAKYYEMFLAERIADILRTLVTFEQLKNVISSFIYVDLIVVLIKSANPMQNQLLSGRKLSRLYF